MKLKNSNSIFIQSTTHPKRGNWGAHRPMRARHSTNQSQAGPSGGLICFHMHGSSTTYPSPTAPSVDHQSTITRLGPRSDRPCWTHGPTTYIECVVVGSLLLARVEIQMCMNPIPAVRSSRPHNTYIISTPGTNAL